MKCNCERDDAFNLLKREAEVGSALTQYRLANDLMEEQCYECSFYWYMKAALKGHIEATWNAGLQLFHGVGVGKNSDAGLHLIHLAANKYCYEAICFLGDGYRMGLYGMTADKQKGDYWKLRAKKHDLHYVQAKAVP